MIGNEEITISTEVQRMKEKKDTMFRSHVSMGTLVYFRPWS